MTDDDKKEYEAAVREFEGGKTVSHHDGRRGLVRCRDCGVGGSLSVEIDPSDSTVWVVCDQCQSDILVSELIEEDISIQYVVRSVDQLDPQIRNMVGEQELRDMVDDARSE